jgi:hypothetical protein
VAGRSSSDSREYIESRLYIVAFDRADAADAADAAEAHESPEVPDATDTTDATVAIDAIVAADPLREWPGDAWYSRAETQPGGKWRRRGEDATGGAEARRGGVAGAGGPRVGEGSGEAEKSMRAVISERSEDSDLSDRRLKGLTRWLGAHCPAAQSRDAPRRCRRTGTGGDGVSVTIWTGEGEGTSDAARRCEGGDMFGGVWSDNVR